MEHIKYEIDSNEQEVIIKLKKWQIPYLVGSARLGIRVQDWCYALWYSYYGCTDDTAFWILNVGKTIQSIKEQATVSEERTNYGKESLEEIQELVNEKCKVNEKEAILRWYEEEGKSLAEEKSLAEAKKKGVVFIPITEDMKEEAKAMTEKVLRETR